MTTALAKAKAKRARRPIYLMVDRLMDPASGELIGCLRPANLIDQRLLRERRFAVGREVRAELKQPRNPGFHRLLHAIGGLLVDNVDEYAGMDAHEAVKAVQTKAGVCCDPETFVIDLGTLGRHEIQRQVPRSIAFDEMEEDEAKRLFDGITAYIGEHYTNVMLDEVRAEFWLMVNGEGT